MFLDRFFLEVITWMARFDITAEKAVSAKRWTLVIRKVDSSAKTLVGGTVPNLLPIRAFGSQILLGSHTANRDLFLRSEMDEFPSLFTETAEIGFLLVFRDRFGGMAKDDSQLTSQIVATIENFTGSFPDPIDRILVQRRNPNGKEVGVDCVETDVRRKTDYIGQLLQILLRDREIENQVRETSAHFFLESHDPFTVFHYLRERLDLPHLPIGFRRRGIDGYMKFRDMFGEQHRVSVVYQETVGDELDLKMWFEAFQTSIENGRKHRLPERR